MHHRSADPLVTTTAGAPLGPEGAPKNPGALAPGLAWILTSQETSYGTVVSQSPSYDPSRYCHLAPSVRGAKIVANVLTFVFPPSTFLPPPSFDANNILWSDNENDTQSALWLLPYDTVGSFVLELSSSQEIYGFRLRNTHNANYNDFGTQAFTIEMSADGSSWSSAVNGTLPSAIDVQSIPFETFTITPVTTRYVRFTARSWYQRGESGGEFGSAGRGWTSKLECRVVHTFYFLFVFRQVPA